MHIAIPIINLLALLLGAFILQPHAFAEESEITFTTRSYGDWQMRCEKAKEAEKTCVMTQQAMVQSSGQRVMQANIAIKGQDTLMTLILPLGIYLPGGAVMAIGEEHSIELLINYCNRSGCIVNHALDTRLIRAMGAAEAVTIKIEISDGQVVNVPLSTKGFFDAHRNL
ncbi:MAG: invasion associated locus B family protein [Gammaproteobacteria bacterium]|nr:invasion associated locus B family protein [Gammaproteobacteria bacterium]